MASPSAAATVYTWGNVKDSGALGHDATDGEGDCPLPVPVTDGLPPSIVAVAAGPDATAAVSDGGELFAWGSGLKLGHGPDAGCVPRPRRVVGGGLAHHQVRTVSLGDDHAGCTTASGAAFTWGSSKRGQCGNAAEGAAEVPFPTLVAGVVGAVALVASNRYTAVLDSEGSLFTFGAGTHGLLGHGHTNDLRTPTRVAFPSHACSGGGGGGGGGGVLSDDPVVQVSCGSLYMGAVTAGGRVFTWGYGGHGNLGHGNRKSTTRPKAVAWFDEHGVEALQISCTACGPNPGGGLNPGARGQGQEGPHTMVVGRRRDQGSGNVGAPRLFTFGTCHKGLLGNFAKKALTGNHDELTPYQVGKDPCRDIAPRHGSKSSGGGGGGGGGGGLPEQKQPGRVGRGQGGGTELRKSRTGRGSRASRASNSRASATDKATSPGAEPTSVTAAAAQIAKLREVEVDAMQVSQG